VKIVFDPDFDGGSWPGPLGGRVACAGEVWVGEAGLLGRLEVALGLTGLSTGNGERTAALVPAVLGTEGFWSRSAEVDPFGAAHRLLTWRDRLVLCGWTGEVGTGSNRIEQLALVTRAVRPGFPDRLRAVTQALSRRRVRVEITEVETWAPLENLSPTWRAAFHALAARGVTITVREVVPAPAGELDLHHSRTTGFHARGDGSLRLLVSDGPLEAAEEVAAWLASLPSLRETLVIAPEAALDWALRRHGLPVTGAPGQPDDNALLQILPLILALGWDPPDPERVLELLTLPNGPVPPFLASRLARSLAQWPAVGSESWNRALAEGLARVEDEADRETLAKRLSRLFGATSRAAGSSLRVTLLRERLALLSSWARGRIEHVGDEERVVWEALLAQLALFSDQLEHSGLDEFSASHLRRLVEQATAASPGLPVHASQAGLPSVAAPGAVVGPARRIVWWGFRRDAVRAERPLPLTRMEREELARAGVELPDESARAVVRAARWRRPLLAASETLVLVAPRRDARGEQAFPHPLWDELAAGDAASEALLRCGTITRTALASRTERRLRPVPRPRAQWSAPRGVLGRRDVESPSGAADLVGCSLKWVLQYKGRLASGLTASLPESSALVGKVTHEVLERVVAEGGEPERAKARAVEIFDAEGPRLAAALFLPGSDAERAAVRSAASSSARVLVALVNGRGVRVETEYKAKAFGGELAGRPDLVLDRPLAVIDLKWSGVKIFREKLADGTAVQLAAYAHLTRDGAAFPPTAYFVIATQEILSVSRGDFGPASYVEGPSAESTWKAMERSYARRLGELEAGILVAPGSAGPAATEELAVGHQDDRSVVLEPPCKFCRFDALCGRAFARERA